MVNWSYYNKFEEINKKYLPDIGEGETMATQIVTAVNKLVYKWYNDGDVFDNTHYLSGWWNDLSSYANWLVKYTKKADILFSIEAIGTHDQYEYLLRELADINLNEEYLEEMNKNPKQGSIYKCDGQFRFVEPHDDDDDDFIDEEEDFTW